MTLMNAKSQKSINRKPVSFIAPGQLAKERGYGKNTSNVAYGSKRIAAEEKSRDDLLNHEMTGESPVHNLFVHYGEDKWEERNITEECSFLDVLSICKRFIDIYSFGIKITDVEGRPLSNDKDLMGLFKEQEHVKNISLYLDKDTTMQPLHFKLPQDNPSFVSVPRASQVRDVLTDDSDSTEMYRQNIAKNAKVSVRRASQVRDLLTDDSDSSVMNHQNTGKNVEDSTRKVRKIRGANKNKKLVALKKGEKLEIQFFHNRAVGPNHQYWSRHLGKIVRNKYSCPIRVRTWKDISKSDKQLMWDLVKEKFYNPILEEYREHTLEHMDTLWTSWRSSLNVKYVKPCKTKALALKNVPRGMNTKDWEWLVTNKFLSDKFQETSSRNANNRAKGVMPHRSGSQPHRQIIYEMGGKKDSPNDIAKIFFATRQKKGKLVEPADEEKYDELVKVVQGNESLSPIAFVDTCFGPQNHSKVFGFGGGMKRKYFHDTRTAHIEQLESKLHEKEEENNDLRRRVEGIESMLTRMVKENQPTAVEQPLRGNDLN